VERYGSADMIENIFDVSTQNEQARQSRNDSRESVGLGWFEFDLVGVHGHLLLVEIVLAASERPDDTPQHHWKTVLSYGFVARRSRV
jgi:hypothetical protein